MNAGKKRVLQILRTSLGGSVGSIALDVSAGVRASGNYSMGLLVGDHQKELYEESFDELMVDSTGAGESYRYLWRLYKSIKSINPDMVIVHRVKEYILLSLVSIFIRSFKPVVVVHQMRGFRQPVRRWLFCCLRNKRSRYITVSDMVKGYMKRFVPCISESKVEVIYNGVNFNVLDVQLKSKETARKELGLEHNAVIFGFMGRLVEAKGIPNLICAFEKMKEKNEGCKLVLMGEGVERKAIENIIESKGLRDSIVLLGRVENGAEYLKAFDYFVFPSVREGFGLALVEAFAAKIPVISSDLEVFKVLSIDGVYLAESGSVASLAKKMEQVLQDDKKSLGRRVEDQYDYVRGRFSVEQSIENYKNFIIKELV